MTNVSIIGRLTADPEMKVTPSGTEVLNFTVADNKGKDRCYFIDCVAFKNNAEFINKYFTKGTWIGITGEIQTRTYKDREEKSHKVTEILVNKVDFVGVKESGTIQPSNQTIVTFEDETDLPF
jgi:single-strand DNA-binding protein